jgi:hypothetical protein
MMRSTSGSSRESPRSMRQEQCFQNGAQRSELGKSSLRCRGQQTARRLIPQPGNRAACKRHAAAAVDLREQGQRPAHPVQVARIGPAARSRSAEQLSAGVCIPERGRDLVKGRQPLAQPRSESRQVQGRGWVNEEPQQPVGRRPNRACVRFRLRRTRHEERTRAGPEPCLDITQTGKEPDVKELPDRRVLHAQLTG